MFTRQITRWTRQAVAARLMMSPGLSSGEYTMQVSAAGEAWAIYE